MHRHAHDPSGGRDVQRRVLLQVLSANAAYFVVELVGGLWTGSLALVADAGHMLTDAGALALALLGSWFAGRPPTPEKSYGFYRAEILAALGNGVALVGIGVYVLVEATRRIGDVPDIEAGPMLAIAAVGLLVNLWSYHRLHRGGEGLNIRGARMHMLADAAGSVAAILAGVAVLTLGWDVADVVVGALVAVLIAVGAWGLVRDAVNVLLEATPSGISLEAVRAAMVDQPDVLSVHDLHVWTLTSGYVALSAHVVVEDADCTQRLLVPLREMLRQRFDIGHSTLQMETPSHADEPIHCDGDPRCLP